MCQFNTTWLISLGVLLAALLFIGVFVKKTYLGVLIDARCRMSLVRLQLVLWSWLLISALFAVGVTFKSMDIEITPEVWALMGISVGSTAGAVIVKGNKSGQTPTDAVPQRLRDQNRQGVLLTRDTANEALFSDLFTGEELTDHTSVDISKVQMFFFTLATAMGYAYAIWNCEFKAEDGSLHFPTISNGLVTLLGISHAGYLTVRAAPKMPTT